MSRYNALHNCSNPYQGKAPRVLCVCSAGLLRSPTMAAVFNQKYGWNTRAAGVHDYALIKVDEVLLSWADVVICAEWEHVHYVKQMLEEYMIDTPLRHLTLPDKYEYMHPELRLLIEQQTDDIGPLPWEETE